MNQNQKQHLIALHSFYKFGPVRLKRLKKYFKNWERAYGGNLKELTEAGIEEKVAQEFLEHRQNVSLEKIMNLIEKEKIGILTLEDEGYPTVLKEIFNPPLLLFYKGKLKERDIVLGVVGTRKYTNYGKQVTQDLIPKLSASGLSIASGMALGIDTLAHNAALDASGRTIAILGSGIDEKNIYPSTNINLAKRIMENNGLLLSEFPLGTPPLRHNFPQRNRIISGISVGVLVVEAGEKSGSLITAHYALEHNRDVFAVPGSIYSSVSKNTNNLIKQGAKITTCAEDILEFLDIEEISSNLENKKIMPETVEEKMILKILSREPAHINQIIRESGLNAQLAGSTLTMMEMKGMIRNIGGWEYVVCF